MKTLFCAIVLASLGLSACGGGNGTSIANNPPPTPAPAPTPSNADVVNLQYPQSFLTSAAALHSTVDSTQTVTAGSSSQSDFATSGTYLKYDKAADSYTLIVGQNGVSDATTFTPAQKGAVGNSQGVPLVTYSQGTAPNTTTLLLGVPGPTGTTLTYTNFGVWLKTAGGAGSGTIDSVAFAYGIPTATTDVPKTGTISYTGVFAGIYNAPGSALGLGGTVSVSGDFATGAINTDFAGNSYGGQGQIVDSFNFAGNGSIVSGQNSYSNTLSGNSGSATGLSGSLKGAFFGPAAAETGGTFLLTGAGQTAVGAFGAKKQ